MNKKIKLTGIFLLWMCLLAGALTSCSDDDNKVDPGLAAVNLTLEKKILQFIDPAASSQTIQLTSNVHWNAVSSKTWCTLSQLEGDGDAELKISVTANTAMSHRTAEILISAGSNYTDTVQVVQFGKDVEYLIYTGGGNTPLVGDTMYLDCLVKKVDMRVLSNVDFRLSPVNVEAREWAELVQLDAETAYDNEHVFTLHVADNTQPKARSGYFTFQQKDGKYTKDFYFKQREFVPELRVNEDQVLGSHFKVAEFLVISLGIENWNYQIVTENGEPTSVDWLTGFDRIECTPLVNNAEDRYYLRAKCEPNNSASPRTCWMDVFYEENGKKISQLMKITQLPWDGRASDSLVLLHLVEKNTVTAYGINLAWSLDAEVTSWERTRWAKFGGFDRITNLGLGEVWLSFDLTAEFANLDELTELNLVKNSLTGPIPEEIAMCSKLERLHIFDNYNDDTYTPSAEPSGITEIPGAIFSECRNLKEVWASTNRIKRLPQELGNAENLESLELSANDMEDLSGINWAGLTHLKSLALASLREYKGPFFDFIFDIPSLESIEFMRTNFDGAVLPDKFDQLPNLTILGMNACGLTGELPKSLGACDKLTTIALSGGDQWEHIHNSFSGELPEEWGNLNYLFSIALENNNITGTIPASYVNLLNIWNRTNEKFSILNLAGNQMRGEIPAIIKEHDTWTGKVDTRTDRNGNIVDTSMGNLSPAICICPQQKDFGFSNCD